MPRGTPRSRPCGSRCAGWSSTVRRTWPDRHSDRAAAISAAGAERRPRRLVGDVDEPVADLAVERRTENDVQVRRLVPVVERGVHHVGVDKDRVAWPERRRLLFEPLLDLARLDD